MARAEKIYLGRDNRLVRELTRAGETLSDEDKLAIQRVMAWINDEVCLDTNNASDPIEYSDGNVTIQAGQASGLTEGNYTIYLTVFDAENANGLAWGSFDVEVVDWPGCST